MILTGSNQMEEGNSARTIPARNNPFLPICLKLRWPSLPPSAAPFCLSMPYLHHRCFFKTHHHYDSLMMGYQISHGDFAIKCSSSEMGSPSDPLNGSKMISPRVHIVPTKSRWLVLPQFLQPQFSSRTPFGVTMNEDSMTKLSFKWRRVLLKISGEALAGDQLQNIDPKVTMAIAREVASVTRLGIEVAIVVGGGNIFRGSSWAGSSSGLDRSSADYIGQCRGSAESYKC